MNILVLTTSFPANSADYRGRFVLDLCHELARKGHKVLALTPHPGVKAKDREIMAGVSVHRVPYPLALGRARGTLYGRHGVQETLRAQPWRLLEVLPSLGLCYLAARRRASWADLVISNWTVPMGLLGARLKDLSPLRHIVIEHGAGARLLQDSGAPLMDYLATRTDLFHYVSQGCARTMHRLSPALTHGEAPPWSVHPMPPPAVESAPVARIYRPPLKLLFVGRFIPIKGVQSLLEALAQVPDATLTLVGDGPGLAGAKQLAQSRGLSTRSHFLGETSFGRLPALYAQHDVLVVPSLALPAGSGVHEEGTPRVLLEAMSAGLVPIVTATGGMPDLVDEGQSGLVCPPGNATELAARLRTLSQSPSQCRRMSIEAARAANDISFDSLFELWATKGVVL